MAKHDLTLLEFLQSFRRGELIAEADEMFAELMEAIGRTGLKGELVIRLPFKPNDAGQIECIPALAMKKPRRAMGTGIYFVSEDNRLTRRDPAQNDLFEDELAPRREQNRDVN